MNGRYYYSSLNTTPKTTTSTLALTDTNSTHKGHNSPRKSAPHPPPAAAAAARRPLPSLNRDLSTRNVCAIVVGLAWATGLGALGGGLWVLQSHSWTESAPTIIRLPEIVKQLAPLALNLWLTLLLDGVGYVHATSLKWALAREGRLGFNSNLRLFTAARGSVPNAWYANLLLFVAMVVAYSSSSLILINDYSEGDSKTIDVDRLRRLWSVEETPINVSSTSTVCLGAALLAQAFVATCALAFTRNPTWSSSPFDAVIACQRETAAEKSVRYHPNRCLLGVTDKEHASEPVRPRARQSSSWAAHREVRVVVLMLWGLAALTLVGAVPVSLVARKKGEPGVRVGGELGVEAGGMLLKTLIFSLLQIGVTLALHCAELLVNLVRDERAWRRAASKHGYRLESYNAVWTAISSWQAFVLFLAKPAIHWVFGLAVTVESHWLYIKGTPFFYLAGAVAALAAYITALSLWRPKGPQPAAYGHIQTLSNLIDEWSPVLYWGHKVSGPTCHAGTSSRPMADIEMDKLYAGEV